MYIIIVATLSNVSKAMRSLTRDILNNRLLKLLNEIPMPTGDDYYFNPSDPYADFVSPFSYTKMKYIIIPEGLIHLKNGSFAGCVDLISIELPKTLQTIGESVFRGCIKLASIVLPKSLVSIGEDAFLDCLALTSINMGDTEITTIPRFAFCGCSKLVSITLPKNLESIGDDAFGFCRSITTIGVSAVENGDGPCDECISMILPGSLRIIGEYAFASCSYLETISLPLSLNGIRIEIGRGAFEDCVSLTRVDLGKTSITVIPDYAFSGCEELNTVTLPNTLTHIGYRAFNHNNLTSISLPASLEFLGKEVFCHCTNLRTIDMSKTQITTIIHEHAFVGCTDVTVYL